MKTTVLIADDNQEVLRSVAEMLREAGYTVIAAATVRAALDLLDADRGIDIVVSDIRMPDVDGFDLFRILRSRFPSLPVVLVTGLPLTDDDMIPRGALILEKPFGIEELRHVIDEGLRRTSHER